MTKTIPPARTVAMEASNDDAVAAERTRFGPAVAAFMLFLSGTAALVFQVLWIKQLSLVAGVDVYAVSTGVSAFFLGLALGSFALGRAGDRSRQPLRLYALLETGVAVLGACVTFILSRIAPVFVAIEGTSPLAAWALLVLIVAMPAFLMGGTLPVLLRRSSGRGRGKGRPALCCQYARRDRRMPCGLLRSHSGPRRSGDRARGRGARPCRRSGSTFPERADRPGTRSRGAACGNV